MLTLNKTGSHLGSLLIHSMGISWLPSLGIVGHSKREASEVRLLHPV